MPSAPSAALAAPVVFVAFLGLSGCMHHRDTSASEVRQSEAVGFSRIDMRGPVDVVVREGSGTQVAITGAPDARSHVQTRVVGDTLVIESSGTDDDGEDDDSCDHDEAMVTIDVPALRSAVVRGAGDLEVQAAGSHAELDLLVLAQGDVRYTGSVDLVRCTIDGSGDVVLRGAGQRLEASLHGSGDLDARDFPVHGGAYEIDGSGDVATVAHGGDMAVHIGGSGDLLYRGDARITSLAVTGEGAVRQLGSSDD